MRKLADKMICVPQYLRMRSRTRNQKVFLNERSKRKKPSEDFREGSEPEHLLVIERSATVALKTTFQAFQSLI